MDQNSEDPDVQTSLKTLKKQESDAELKQKAAVEELRKQEALKNQAKQELDNIKGIKDDNTNQQARNDKFTNIDAQLESLNNKKNELKQMKSTMEANKKLLEGLNTALLAKQDELVGYQAILDQLITEETLAKEAPKSKIKKTASDLGDKYTEADAKDGNWWKRNMPSWLGGASKEDKEAMKKAHEAKDDAVDAMKALGGSKSDLKEMQKENVAKSVESFLSRKQTFDGIKDDITDAIRTGGTAAAENVYNKKLENLAEKKATDLVNDLTNKISKSTKLSDAQKKEEIEKLKDRKESLIIDFMHDINLQPDTELFMENIGRAYQPPLVKNL